MSNWQIEYYRDQIHAHGGMISEQDGTVRWPHIPHPGTLTHSIVSDADKLARDINEYVLAGEKDIGRALRDFAATIIRDHEARKEPAPVSGETDVTG